MPSSIFQRILNMGNASAVVSQGVKAAATWFRTMARRMTSVSPHEIMRTEPERLLKMNRIGSGSMGKMIMYFYDPKTKKRLPYYDRFPVIFPVDPAPGGFYGINLHYLHPYQRAKLMDELLKLEIGQHTETRRKLQLSYGVLKSTSNLRAFRPCFKRYLYSHVRSRLFIVKREEWDMVALLPTERFERGGKGGAKVGSWISNREVWAASRRIIGDL